jgi:heat shock protein HtpX
MEEQVKKEKKKDPWDIFFEKKPAYVVCAVFYVILSGVATAWTFKISDMFGLTTWGVIGTLFIISQSIVFSRFSEKLLRFFNNVRRLESAQEKEFLRPIFSEVYDKAKEANPELADNNIDIYIMDSMAINAFAIGRSTVAVTKGLLTHLENPEIIKPILAHEIAHILHMDTITKIYTLIGNGIISLNIIIVKAAYALMKRSESLRFSVEVTERIFDAFCFVLLFGMQIAVAVHDRQAERRADCYALQLGYGEEMVVALYELETLRLGGGGVIDRLTASHPRLTSRIEALEVELGIQEVETWCPRCNKRCDCDDKFCSECAVRLRKNKSK